MKRKKKTPKQLAQAKGDELFQEIGRNMYQQCACCSKPMSCLHHFHPKSRSTGLRYDLSNGVPICVGCHNLHHSANDPNISSSMVLFMTEQYGSDWEIELRRKREILKNVKKDLAWYKTQIDILQELLNNSEANAYLPPQDLWRT